jgi:hypothetical protein
LTHAHFRALVQKELPFAFFDDIKDICVRHRSILQHMAMASLVLEEYDYMHTKLGVLYFLLLLSFLKRHARTLLTCRYLTTVCTLQSVLFLCSQTTLSVVHCHRCVDTFLVSWHSKYSKDNSQWQVTISTTLSPSCRRI